MTTRALKDFMGASGRRRGSGLSASERVGRMRGVLLGNATLADFGQPLLSHLPKLFPLFCAFCPRQKEDAAKKGTSSRKKSPSGPP